MKKQSGLSSTELLISLFLASFIGSLMIQIYITDKKHYLIVQRELQTNFDIHWVSELLKKSIRSAGFTPCIGLDHLTVFDHRDHTHAIKSMKINPAGDLIHINRMNDHFEEVIHITSSTRIEVSSNTALTKLRPIIISDCTHAEIHQVQEVYHLNQQTELILKEPLKFSYESQAFVGEWLEEEWFIKINAQGKRALFCKQLQHTEELTELIHTLVIKKTKFQHKQGVEVMMALEKEKQHSFIVRVRG